LGLERGPRHPSTDDALPDPNILDFREDHDTRRRTTPYPTQTSWTSERTTTPVDGRRLTRPKHLGLERGPRHPSTDDALPDPNILDLREDHDTRRRTTPYPTQ